MNVKTENLEKNMAKITVTVESAEFVKAVKESYERNKGNNKKKRQC